MKNQEQYRQMMNEIHVSDATLRKVMEINMNKGMLNRRNFMRKMEAIAAAMMICLIGSNGIAYAATGETWLTKAIVYINGEKVTQDVLLEDHGDGTITFKMDNLPKEFNTEMEGVIVKEEGTVQADFFFTEDKELTFGGIVKEGEKIFFEFGEEKIDITEDMADGEATGTFAISGKQYDFHVLEENGDYSYQMNASEK